MNHKVNVFENGLRFVLIPLPSLKSATVTVWVGVGSRYESDRLGGISHFLEHMVFKGSRKRPSAKQIAESIDAFGGEFNASTSKEWTNYYIKSRSEKIETAIDVLSDMVLNPILKGSDIEREKGVILEEMAMYEDTPIAKIHDYFERLIFEGNDLARDVIGTKESVKGIKRSDFLSFREKHLGSGDVVITIAGGVDEKKVTDLVRKYFSGFKLKDKAGFEKFKESQDKPKVYLHRKKIEQAHIILGFMGNRRGHKAKYAEAVLTSILGGGMSSRMFTEVREKRGLAYAIKTSRDNLHDTGYLSTYAGVDLKRIDQAIDVILKQYYKISKGKNEISIGELKKAKEYIKGHLALALEDTKDVNSFFGVRELLEGKIETPEEVFKRIDGVTAEEVVGYAREVFVPGRLNLALVGPFDDEKRFEKLLS